MSVEHEAWCRMLWANLNDGATWAVPRSGLVFQKDSQRKALVLLEGGHGGYHTDPDEDLKLIRAKFARIGIKVVPFG